MEDIVIPNRICGLAFALLGAVALWLVIPAQTATVSYGATTPALFPSIGAATMLAAGLWLAAFPTGRMHPNGRAILGAALLAALTAGAVWAMTRFGYLVAAPPAVVLLMLFSGQRNILWLLLGALAPAVIWAIFTLGLDRALP